MKVAMEQRLRTPLAIAAVVVGLLTIVEGGEAADGIELTDAAFAPELIAELTAQLDDDDPEQRILAIRALEQLGPEARPAVPKLVELLSDQSTYHAFGRPVAVDNHAHWALQEIGMQVVTLLGNALQSDDAETRERVVRMARELGPVAREWQADFIRGYEAAIDPYDQLSYLSAVAGVDPTGERALPLLLKALAESEYELVRRAAAEYLQRSPFLTTVYWSERAPAANWFRNAEHDPIEVARALAEALQDESPDVRAMAATALSTYPEAADLAVPSLMDLLSDDASYWVANSNHMAGEVAVAASAAAALTKFPEFSDQSLPVVIDAMYTEDSWYLGTPDSLADLAAQAVDPVEHIVRILDGEHPETAFVALARIGPRAAPAIARLEELIVGEDQSLMILATITVACIDTERQQEARVFIEYVFGGFEEFADSRESHTRSICRFLTDVGPNAAFAAPAVIKHFLTGRETEELTWDVVEAVSAIGPPAADAAPYLVDSLVALFDDLSERNEDALVALGPTVIPLVIDALNDETRPAEHRWRCLRILGRFKSTASEAVPAVILHLDSEHPRIREAAAEALGLIAAHANESLPALQRALHDPRVFVRVKAATSIAAFRLEAGSAVPSLIEALSDDYLDVQVSAAAALGSLGGSAVEAVAAIESLSGSDNVLLRETAREALTAIEENL